MIRTVAALALVSVALPASASVTLTYSDVGASGVDAAFEGPGGYLNAVRGFPVVSGSALVPLERSVGQLRQSGQRRAHYLPTPATGLPVADGGTGVTNALTNVPPFGASGTDFGNGVALPFSLTRAADVITFTFGSDVLASDSRLSLGDVNAFEFRIRSDGGSAANSITYSDLTFTDSLTANQVIPGFTAGDGDVLIQLWEGIAPGDFSLTGSITQSWTGGDRPGGSALATQIKLLDVPTSEVPEPSTWAMLLAGFGFLGAAMRRNRRRTATVSYA